MYEYELMEKAAILLIERDGQGLEDMAHECEAMLETQEEQQARRRLLMAMAEAAFRLADLEGPRDEPEPLDIDQINGTEGS